MADRYRVTLSDGRIVTLEADHQPSEADVLMAIGEQTKHEPSMSAASPNTALPPGSPEETDPHGNRIVRNPDGSVKFMQGPGFSGNADTSPDRNAATVGGFGIAPEDILTVPSLVSGAKAVVRGVSNLAGKVLSPSALRYGADIAEKGPIRMGVAGGLRKVAGMLDAPAATTAAEAIAPEATTAVESIPKGWGTPKPTLKPEEIGPWLALKAQGKSGADAMDLVLAQRGTVPAVEAVATKATIPTAGEVATMAQKIPALTGEEFLFAQKLRARGKTFDEIRTAILAQRELMKMPGVQSNATVAARVAERNATGRWP